MLVTHILSHNIREPIYLKALVPPKTLFVSVNIDEEDHAISRVVKAGDRTLEGKTVRLVDPDNQQLGIVPVEKALAVAEETGYDLVVVADKASPPVCRLMNYGKYLYEKNKREREQKRKQQTQKNKEIKFHANIDDHDFEIKLKHILEFLEKGYRVKVSLFYRGREMAHREIGMELMQRIIEEVGEKGQVDSRPRMQGRTVSMQLTPN